MNSVVQVLREEIVDTKTTRCAIDVVMDWCNIYSFLLVSIHLCITATHYRILAAGVKMLAGVHLKTYKKIL